MMPTNQQNKEGTSRIGESMYALGITPTHLTVLQVGGTILATIGGVSADTISGAVMATVAFGLSKGLDFADGTYARYLNKHHHAWGPYYQGETLDPHGDKISVYLPNTIMSGAAFLRGDYIMSINIILSSLPVGWNDIKSSLRRGMPNMQIVGDTLRVPFIFRRLTEEERTTTSKGANPYGKWKTTLQGVGQSAFMLAPALTQQVPHMQWIGTTCFVGAFVLSILSLNKKSIGQQGLA